LPDKFGVVHKQHVPSASCELELHYDWHTIRRIALPDVPDFKPHPEFEKYKKGRM
jgi:hypothetical protein